MGSFGSRAACAATGAESSPPRPAGTWELDTMLRAFLALERLGGGFLLSAGVGYRFESNVHVRAQLDPFGIGDAEGEDASAPLAGFVYLGYDQRLFEVGLGIGGQTVHSVPIGTELGSGTLLVQGLRMGSVDGLHLALRSDVVLFHSEFSFSGFSGAGQIPVGDASWLLFRGAGGNAGYGYGEIGVKVLLRGNGGQGSMFLTVAAGGAVVFRSETFRSLGPGTISEGTASTSTSGPMVGAGATWRF
jgi:hypothetical protein